MGRAGRDVHACIQDACMHSGCVWDACMHSVRVCMHVYTWSCTVHVHVRIHARRLQCNIAPLSRLRRCSADCLAGCRLAQLSDEVVVEVLLVLVERLGKEQEVGWLDSIAQELVGVADMLREQPKVRGREAGQFVD